jgi:hypothetical protein
MWVSDDHKDIFKHRTQRVFSWKENFAQKAIFGTN